MGTYDAEAQVDYIIEKTGRRKITFIGHSQGNTQMFYILTREEHRDKWLQKLNGLIALAPMTNLKNND